LSSVFDEKTRSAGNMNILNELPHLVILQASLICESEVEIALVDSIHGDVLDCQKYFSPNLNLELLGMWVDDYKETLREAGVV